MFTGHQLKEYRQKRGWTQAQLGYVTCMSRDAIAKIEQRNRVINDVELLKTLQKSLNIPYNIIGFIPIDTFL